MRDRVQVYCGVYSAPDADTAVAEIMRHHEDGGYTASGSDKAEILYLSEGDQRHRDLEPLAAALVDVLEVPRSNSSFDGHDTT